MRKLLLLSMFLLITNWLYSQTNQYNEMDKEGLRNILRLEGMEYGDTGTPYKSVGFIAYGLVESDTLSWYESEEWVGKINFLTWSEDSPKRLIKMNVDQGVDNSTLDLSFFEELQSVHASIRKYAIFLKHVTLDISKNDKLKEVGGMRVSFTENSFKTEKNIESIHLYNSSISLRDWSNLPHLKKLYLNGSYGERYVDFSPCKELTHVTITDHAVKELDFSKNENLEYLNCSSGLLERLYVSDSPKLKYLNCSYNNLRFSTMPAREIETYIYEAATGIWSDSEIPWTGELDFSTEYIIAGATSKIEFFDEDANPSLVELEGENGKFRLTEELVGKRLVCIITNEWFPGLGIMEFFDVLPAPVGIKDVSDDVIKINSTVVNTGGNVILSSNGKSEGTVHFYNVSGQKLSQQKILGTNMEIPVPDKVGIYILKVELNDGENYTFKIIVR